MGVRRTKRVWSAGRLTGWGGVLAVILRESRLSKMVKDSELRRLSIFAAVEH